jgi:hypothetical protein
MRPPALRARTLTAGLRDRREGSQDRVQEPAKPDTLAPAFVSHPVHAIVPVARSDEREPVRTDCEASIESRGTMVEQ